MNSIAEKLKSFVSKKLLALILVPIVMAGNKVIGSPLTEQNITELVYAVIAYLVGQSAVDTVKAGKKTE